MANPIPILFEDDSYVVFNKPAGLIVIPSPKKETRTLVSLVNAQERTGVNQAKYYPCHRLDRDTSGVILFSKGKKNQQMMMAAFRDKQVEKKYWALVNGIPVKDKGKFTGSVASLDRKKRNPLRPAQPAVTEYQIFRKFKNYSQMEINLITGRSNQIRIHFAKAGNPLIGERKYAIAKKYPYKFRRVALHAFSLQWLHPITKKNIIVKSPMPQDMEDFINNNK